MPTTACVPCSNCGDMKPADARRCSHCGHGNSSGNALLDGSFLVLQIIGALWIGMLVLPLGACGGILVYGEVVRVFQGQSSFPFFLLLGVGMLALAAGGIYLLFRLFRK